MTIHSLYEQSYSSVPGAVTVYASGVGNTSSDMTSVKGVTSIARTGTGLYTVTLHRAFAGGLLGVDFTTLTSATAANFNYAVTGSTVATDGKFTIACLSSASNAATAPIIADMLTTDTLLMKIHVQDSATKPSGR